MSTNRPSAAGLTITLWTVVVLMAAVATMVYALMRPMQMASVPVAALPTKLLGVPTPSKPALSKPAIPLPVHGTPPDISPAVLLTLLAKVESQSRSMPSYLVTAPTGTFILTTASRLTQPEWSSLAEVTVMLGAKPVQLRKTPDWLGPLTYDNHPNMLQNPDLSEDLAWWSCKEPGPLTPLSLRSSPLEQQQPVWLLALPVAQPPRWVKAHVVRSLPTQVDVKVLERIEVEQLIGGIILDDKHEFAGTVLGGNDDIATGAPSVAILDKLKARR